MAKYQVFEGINRKTGSKTVTVVSHFAGKAVRGIAKCDPDKDEYNLEAGTTLAKARCDMKVASKRLSRAQQKVAEAEVMVRQTQEYLARMREYEADAQADFIASVEFLADREKELED